MVRWTRRLSRREDEIVFNQVAVTPGGQAIAWLRRRIR
jgi:hypothetical protein